MAIQTKLPSLIPTSERLKKTIKLISGGYSLKPEINDGMVTVYPWDSEISEWVMSAEKAADFDFTSRVVRKLVRLPDSVMDRFVASELLLVMLVARSLVTNGTLRYTAVCPHCKTAQLPSTVAVPDQLGKIGEKAGDYQGWDTLTLPESGDVLKVRPLLVSDVRRAAESRSKDISETGLSTAASILEVNGGKPEKMRELVDYYLALPPKDIEALRTHLRTSSPALDTNIPHICDNKLCEKPFHFNLGLHYDFFLSSL